MRVPYVPDKQSLNMLLLLLLHKKIKPAFRLLTNDLPGPAAASPQGCRPHIRHIETGEIWRLDICLTLPSIPCPEYSRTSTYAWQDEPL